MIWVRLWAIAAVAIVSVGFDLTFLQTLGVSLVVVPLLLEAARR